MLSKILGDTVTITVQYISKQYRIHGE